MTITLSLIINVVAYIYAFVHIILALVAKDVAKESKHLLWALVIMLAMISDKILIG